MRSVSVPMPPFVTCWPPVQSSSVSSTQWTCINLYQVESLLNVTGHLRLFIWIFKKIDFFTVFGSGLRSELSISFQCKTGLGPIWVILSLCPQSSNCYSQCKLKLSKVPSKFKPVFGPGKISCSAHRMQMTLCSQCLRNAKEGKTAKCIQYVLLLLACNGLDMCIRYYLYWHAMSWLCVFNINSIQYFQIQNQNIPQLWQYITNIVISNNNVTRI